MTKNRAAAAFEEVLAVESMAPGMARVVTLSDHWMVDVRQGVCRCPDFEYNLQHADCKHLVAARDAIGDLGIGHFEACASLADRGEWTADGGGQYVRAQDGSEATVAAGSEVDHGH